MAEDNSHNSRYHLSIKNLTNTETQRAFALIILICGILRLCFAYAAGWIFPRPLTQTDIIARFEKLGGLHEGFRRNHAKGVCVSGYFEGNGNGIPISTAPLFKGVKTPVFGRFALAGPNPFQPDKAAQVRSMALNFMMADGQVWRTGMNDIPVFTVKTPQGFYDLLKASHPDPATEKPDPDAMAAFFEKYPESAIAIPIIKSRPISSGFSDARYNALNAFLFVNAQGKETPVRWSMIPVDPFTAANTMRDNSDNYLFNTLRDRLKKSPAQWHLVVTLGEAGDPIEDATKPWPQQRSQVNLGTLTLTNIQDEDHGECRDINFDPLILPEGIKPSADPLLSARSAAYAKSFTARESEPKTPSNVSYVQEDK